MKRVILDTNALMAVAEVKIDLFRELERACDFPYVACVLEGTIHELKQIQHKERMKYARAAQLALSLLEFKGVKIVKEKGVVDNLLVRHSWKGDLVLTQDTLLKRRLRKPYLTIRQKKRIVMIR